MEAPKRIKGAAFGEGGADYMSVIVEVGDSRHYAHVYRDRRMELVKGSFFSKADFYGTDPRGFWAILQGCHPPHTTNPCFQSPGIQAALWQKAVLQVACSKASRVRRQAKDDSPPGDNSFANAYSWLYS